MHYTAHLSRDKKLKTVIEQQEAVKLVPHRNICLRLCASIMSQQLSTKVAEVIYKRFLQLFGGEEPSPEQIAATPTEVLRGIGLSGSKCAYVQNVARFALENDLDDERLKHMSNEEITALLTQIKGVGKWTVEMLLMFTLGREDVFAVDDYGIQTAMKKLYGLDDTNKKEFRRQLLELSQQWTPYRTYACMHLWRWKDTPATT
ncbi:DNA-3-methyladenine glycosylase 2 family protein [Paraflavisolibacter sp. H34]|uniref:DNA-3-methyladenine glycosylase family protein n=1 Tax=Huijunlia imazamoxiresistens TaxID=3127457 RepID=UPI0030195768